MGPIIAAKHFGFSAGSLSSLQLYVANVPITGTTEEPREWLFTLRVESSMGEATVDFPVKVQQPGGGIDVILIAAEAVVFGLILGFLVWSLLASRRRKPKEP